MIARQTEGREGAIATTPHSTSVAASPQRTTLESRCNQLSTICSATTTMLPAQKHPAAVIPGAALAHRLGRAFALQGGGGGDRGQGRTLLHWMRLVVAGMIDRRVVLSRQLGANCALRIRMRFPAVPLGRGRRVGIRLLLGGEGGKLHVQQCIQSSLPGIQQQSSYPAFMSGWLIIADIVHVCIYPMYGNGSIRCCMPCTLRCQTYLV